MKYWNNFYKHERGTLAVANMVYEPLINPDKDIFKMNFNSNQYVVNSNMTDDFRQNWFAREINYIEKLNVTKQSLNLYKEINLKLTNEG